MHKFTMLFNLMLKNPKVTFSISPYEYTIRENVTYWSSITGSPRTRRIINLNVVCIHSLHSTYTVPHITELYHNF